MVQQSYLQLVATLIQIATKIQDISSYTKNEWKNLVFVFMNVGYNAWKKHEGLKYWNMWVRCWSGVELSISTF